MRKYLVLLLSSVLLLGACNESCHDWSAVTAQPPVASSNESGSSASSQNEGAGALNESDDQNADASNNNAPGEDTNNNNTSNEEINNDNASGEGTNNNSTDEDTDNNSSDEEINNDDALNEDADDNGASNDNGSQSTSDTDDEGTTGEAAQALEMPGLGNLYRVSEKLYRSAQPMQGGLVSAQSLGIRTVLSLQIVDFDSGLDETADLSLSLVHVPMVPSSVTDEDVLKALRVIQASDEPVLVHCLHGADRTGTVVAMYRVVFQNWSKDKAIDEMMNGGFGYHVEYANLVELIQRADIAEYRQSLGL